MPAIQIPQRPILYASHIPGLTSATIGRPGVGKTKLVITEALAKVTGRRLLHDMPTGKFRVWCWFGEEAQEDIDRLLTAAMDHYGITQADIAGRLFISSRDQRMVAATHNRNGLTIARPIVREVKRFLQENAIDSGTIDPFVKSHGAPENDNTVIDQVTGIWSEIAHECRCHLDLDHHTRKTGGAPITIEDVRGGSAIVGAVRSVRILNAMTAEEAERAGVEHPWAHVRIDDGKGNNLPPAKARWFKLATVGLAHGDAAGVATPWEWPTLLPE